MDWLWQCYTASLSSSLHARWFATATGRRPTRGTLLERCANRTRTQRTSCAAWRSRTTKLHRSCRQAILLHGVHPDRRLHSELDFDQQHLRIDLFGPACGSLHPWYHPARHGQDTGRQACRTGWPPQGGGDQGWTRSPGRSQEWSAGRESQVRNRWGGVSRPQQLT